jgi:CDGSH iron-sulfur domain-containing protein 3
MKKIIINILIQISILIILLYKRIFFKRTYKCTKKLNPKTVKLEKGKTYYYCECGYSKNQPFCDGTHIFIKTDKKPLKFEVKEKSELSSLCQCKITNTPPFCDGNHINANSTNYKFE